MLTHKSQLENCKNILGLNFDKHINFGRGGSGQLYAVNNLVGSTSFKYNKRMII